MAKKRKEPFTIGEVITTVENFKNLINFMQQNVKFWDEEISRADKSFTDIYHFCELRYPTERTEKTKVCKLIHDIATVRRQYKDLKQLYDVLRRMDFIENSNKANKFNEVCNQVIVKGREIIENKRQYKTRELHELWIDTIKKEDDANGDEQ